MFSFNKKVCDRVITVTKNGDEVEHINCTAVNYVQQLTDKELLAGRSYTVAINETDITVTTAEIIYVISESKLRRL